MKVKVKLYVEGGGDGHALKTKCRQGFKLFLEKAGLAGRMPAVVACGSRTEAYSDFCMALKNAGPYDLPVLLVDSEEPVSASSTWHHLKARAADQWERPSDAQENQAHLMVQCMEAWFLADRIALQAYFGQGFAASALPGNQNFEDVSKELIFKALKLATRHSAKGEYGKGKHSFDLLAEIDPQAVQDRSPHAADLVQTLKQPRD